jgi:hypothetical protein
MFMMVVELVLSEWRLLLLCRCDLVVVVGDIVKDEFLSVHYSTRLGMSLLVKDLSWLLFIDKINIFLINSRFIVNYGKSSATLGLEPLFVRCLEESMLVLVVFFSRLLS